MDAAPPRRLAILRWRRIGPPTADDWLTTTAVEPDRLEEQLRQLRRGRWTPVTAEQAVAGLDSPAGVPERATLLTFEGGYRSFAERALPILRRHRWPCALFVATDPVGETATHEPDLDAPAPMLGWSELTALPPGEVSVQSMGASARRLSGLEPVEVERELTHSRATLENRLGTRVDLFAYPGGDRGIEPAVTARVLRLSGYRAALGAGGGVTALPPADRWHVSRVLVTPSTDLSAELGG